MPNELIVDTNWQTCKDIFYTDKDSFRKIWEKHYKKKNHCCSYHMNQYRFNNITRPIRDDLIKFMMDRTYYIKDKDLIDGYLAISGLNHLQKIILMVYKQKQNFFLNHVKIKEIKWRKSSRLILSFDRFFMSYIVQTIDERYSISILSDDFSIKEFLLYKFSETETNKKRKQKEIDRLYDICMGVLER